MARPETPMMSEATAESLMPVSSSSFSRRWTIRPRSRVAVVRARVRSRSSRTGCGRHEGGPDQAVGAELGQPGRVRDVRLAAGQVLDLPRVDQDHVQALGQHVVEGLPVVRGRLDHHQRHPCGEQMVPQGQDRVRRRSPRRGLGREGPPPLRTRGADARLGVLLADVQAGAAFVQHVHGLAPSLAAGPSYAVPGGPGWIRNSDARASQQHSTVPVDGPQHHADLRAHRHHRSIGFGRNEPLQRPDRHQPTSGRTEAPPARATAFTTPPARTEGALGR